MYLYEKGAEECGCEQPFSTLGVLSRGIMPIMDLLLFTTRTLLKNLLHFKSFHFPHVKRNANYLSFK